MTRVLAVASGGGHWVQLLRLQPAFAGTEVRWMTTKAGYSKDVDTPLFVVQDANLTKRWAMFKMFLQVGWVVLRLRPDVIVTTGAAPGLAALAWGRVVRAKTVWIDSIANAEELSGSGAKAKHLADVWLTQWEHLARPGGPGYWGGVL